ncbi:MAG: rod shape-determining protein RodA [Candidatus Nanopelagicales bacterium]
MSYTLKEKSRTGFWQGYDFILISSVFILSFFGSFLVYSASRQRLIDAEMPTDYFLQRHLLNILLGIILGLTVSRFSYRTVRAYAIVIYVVALFGSIVVLIPGIGRQQSGAQAWLALPGGLSFQPSEFTKLALIVLLAMVLTEKRDAEERPNDSDVLIGLALAGIPTVFILIQNDLGTALIVTITLLAVLIVSGVRAKWILGLLLATFLAGVATFQLGILKQYQLDRLTSFTNPAFDPQGIGYNTLQARIAIGSGGWFGQGFLNGSQTQGKYIPAQRTDFIFTVVGEEFGFLGISFMLILYFIILYRISRIAWRAPDLFGRLTATGVTAWFAVQSFENIGMNLGIMPVTGVPLPFVSYGGSAMFVSWIAVGLVLAIGRETNYRKSPLLQREQ